MGVSATGCTPYTSRERGPTMGVPRTGYPTPYANRLDQFASFDKLFVSRTFGPQAIR